MMRYVAIGCLGVGLLASPLFGGPAPTAVPSSVQKIAVVDMESVMTTTPAAKRVGAQLAQFQKTNQATLDQSQADMKRAIADLDKQAPVLRPDVLEQKKAALAKQAHDVEQLYIKLERDLDAEKTKLGQQLLLDAKPKIERIAKQQGVTLVLDTAGVMYADPSIDITPLVSAQMP